MAIDFRNINTVWASILVETLQYLGLTTAIISPGSRSTPLTFAFATHPKIETIPILDERSASFFALGIARKNYRPVVIVCTSGTAAANFYPAIIEAKESRIPLLVLTADRPPELRNCHAGQTIDQVKLYGSYPNWQVELSLPSIELKILEYLRQTIIHGWRKTILPTPGPVHFNIPFRDPLPPIPQPEVISLEAQFPQNFFATVQPIFTTEFLPNFDLTLDLKNQLQSGKGIIIAGLAQPKNPQKYCQAIAQISQILKFPVLAEGLSPLRNYSRLNPYLISTYDLILRNQEIGEKLIPKIVLQIGELPTSKQLRNWLERTNPHRLIMDQSEDNFDPLHGKTNHLRLSVEQLAQIFTPKFIHSNSDGNYLNLWCNAEVKVREAIDKKMEAINQIFEPKIPWLISQILPQDTPIFIANSMPVRDVEFFWVPNNSQIKPFFNRGANGIDGTLSTALGIAHRQQSSVLLTGDLALLHDTNGFLLRNKLVGHLTIILINNQGGGIFEMLPIAKFEPPFTEFFATPQDINFAALCNTYNVEHQNISSWQQLQQLLNTLPSSGIRVLEIQTNRRLDARWRLDNLDKFAAPLKSLVN
ncbi:MAG: 2-succinyl-5-enolpyruvyl-6-hydroxy-3-cyclohexene-1-carboxylic-acid synthase [Okeania sp. SIO2C9]|uniref:2-succinyl-5-enolpyruvyl-6-hydroxy-3- cyclohexene-1-carboxylic-acid synthase n=1 Tax=Okeania sp. SIO2C9 TaxID=2607791 RepID=UPI0013BFC075|nr:2-succinyl-5-enolpyruvyl-6-hydroxy-3-cyclohexene-1-carboxylic-acid synthase [Okeania sp. SIO2C9]NEQ73319.1 2-succinyl-5-enolpyruvyl-6-hydroxy-3-cyclohexene-1-carboxylic-acid synthase [Okeania sp. SIO2C9]